MKKSTVKKIPTSLTIQEFKMWLDGLCAFNADDWTPNFQQWTAIRERIMNLRDAVKQPTMTPPVQHMNPRAFAPPQQELYASPQNITISDDINLTEEDIARKIAEAKKYGASNAIKTPNIDSSNGYKSSFT